MLRIVAISLLTCASVPGMHALEEKLADAANAQKNSTNKLGDEVAHNLLDRALQARLHHTTALENTTLGKDAVGGPGGTPPSMLSQFGMFGITAAVFGVSKSVAIVPPGEVGLVTTFGKMHEQPLKSGMSPILPVSEVRKVSVKTRKLDEDVRVPTKEGLTVDLETAILYHLDPTRITNLYTEVGERFQENVIIPEVRSIVRGLTSEAEAKALYTSGRGHIQKRLKEELTGVLSQRGIIIEDVLLKAIKLPHQLVQAIELKAQAEQEAQRMEFVLAKEQQEAARKTIEAKGIADYQQIVSQGIDDKLLQWKGIEATVKLAESPNSKVVVMGNGKHSLPVVLSGGQ